MAVITQRRGGYKAGLLLFLVGLVAFITGFATPNWCEYTYKATSIGFVLRGHAGLWVSCYKGHFGESHCLESSQSRGWDLVVKGLECTSLAFAVLSLFYAIYINFLASTITYIKLLEIGTGIAGGLGLAGAITYVTKLQQGTDFLDNLKGHDFDFNVSWSFGVTLGGSVLIIIANVLLSLFNRPLQQQQPPPATTLTDLNAYGSGVPMGTPSAPPQGITPGVYATPGTAVHYAAPPPAYYALTQPGQGQFMGPGQGQGQVSAPMVFDTPVGGQKQ